MRYLYNLDPLICPQCRETRRIVSFIENQEGIQTILRYLGLWDIRSRPLAKAHAPPAVETATERANDPRPHDTTIYGNPQYPWEAYL